MYITSIAVNKVPKTCDDCMFYKFPVDEDSYFIQECTLKEMMHYPEFGRSLAPCPLDGLKGKEAK